MDKAFPFCLCISYVINKIMFSSSSLFRDLKRDIAKKLEKLERRTQKAIVEIIRMLSYMCVCGRGKGRGVSRPV